MSRSVARFMALWGWLLICGCTIKPLSTRGAPSLVVVADPLIRPAIRSAIESRFGEIIETPQPEPRFDIYWEDGESLRNRTRYPLILMTGSLDMEDGASDLIRRMLSTEVAAGVESGDYRVFTLDDPWAQGQMMMVVVGRTAGELAVNMESLADTLLSWCEEFQFRILEKDLFDRGEQVSLGRDLRKRFGFKLRVQHDYSIAEDDDSLNFIRMMRYRPERWVLVAWGEMAADSLLTPEFVFHRRKTLGKHFFDPVRHYDDHWGWKADSLDGRRAIMVRGLWATEGPQGGGPFFSLAVRDSARNRYYIIDGAVMAPGEEKMPYLWQLETIARIFRLP